MNIFLFYARKDKNLVLSVSGALNLAGFQTFLDSNGLPIGEEFNTQISAAIKHAGLFMFFVSQHSTLPRSFALTELSFAEAKWINPSGYVLLVIIDGFDTKKLPLHISNI